MNVCSICDEEFNKTTRKCSSCFNCHSNFCRECLKAYIISETGEIRCPAPKDKCNALWNLEFLYNELPKNFIDRTYRQRRGDLLLELEKSLLPETQPLAEAERTKRNKMNKIREKQTELFNMIMTLRKEYSDLEDEYYKTSRERFSPSHKTYIVACPNESCRGFVDEHYSCGMCSTKVCEKCHRQKETEHKCDKNEVESIKLKKKDSKSCPSCHVLIHKITGCDQMWCTNCHTPWDWRTGSIIKDKIHNPHYFDWLNNTNTNHVQDAGRGRRIIMNRLYKNRDRFFLSVLEICNHILGDEIPRLTEDVIQLGRDLRVKYLLGDIHEKEWKRQLELMERRSEKKSKLRDILEAFREDALDILSEISEIYNIKEVQQSQFRQQIKSLLLNSNKQLTKISKMFSRCAVPYFCPRNEYYGGKLALIKIAYRMPYDETFRILD